MSSLAYAPTIVVSREKYKEFFDGEVWADILDMLEGRLMTARALTDIEKDHVTILGIQGAIEELKYLIELPETIMQDYTFEAGKNIIPLDLDMEDDDGPEGREKDDPRNR